MNNATMRYVIDWELNQESFRRQVRELIRLARKNGKVIALPMRIQSGQLMVDLMTLLLAQVNCDNCNAPCCKRSPNEELIQLLPPEYDRLAEKYGAHHFRKKGEWGILPMPCPFLKKGPHPQLKELCTIYRDRPLVCLLYPFQPGATNGDGDRMLAVASSCPEARRITRNIYMMAWRIRHQFRLLGAENFLKGIL